MKNTIQLLLLFIGLSISCSDSGPITIDPPIEEEEPFVLKNGREMMDCAKKANYTAQSLTNALIGSWESVGVIGGWIVEFDTTFSLHKLDLREEYIAHVTTPDTTAEVRWNIIGVDDTFQMSLIPGEYFHSEGYITLCEDQLHLLVHSMEPYLVIYRRIE